MFPIDFLRDAAYRHADLDAVVTDATRLSHAEALERADALATGLQHLTGRARMVVGVCGRNSLDQFLAIVACHAAGAILVPLNPRLARGELQAQIGLVEPDVLIVDESCLDSIGSVETIPRVVGGRPDSHYPHTVDALMRSWRGHRPRWPAVSALDASAYKFTGGSSGAPKAVVQPFRCITTLLANTLHTFKFDRHERHLCIAPITHAAGALLLPVLAAGGCNYLVGTTDAPWVMQVIEQQRITALFAPPTLLYALMDSDPERVRDRSSLRHVLCGGAPLALSRSREARDYFHGALEVIYGQTEVPMLISALRADELADEKNLESAGRPSPYVRLAIRSERGQELPPGECGEIVVQTDMSMTGYLGMPEETARTIVDGWIRTGDVGCLDCRGYLYLKDRLRDVVISGGFNIYPSDVEAALAAHPAIREAVAFGVPDEKWGERVEAAVELHQGQAASVAQLMGFAREALGSVKAPKAIHVVASLPRSSVGKVLRRLARESALAARVEA